VASTFDRGREFEDVARRFLVERGWTVLGRNVRFGRREIDLIVRRGTTVAFVEVKGRRGSGFGHPLDAITPRKRSEIHRVARWWILRHGLDEWEYRFDAVAVSGRPGETPAVEHVEDAWRIGP
jgi:putative endonuclease